MRDRNQLQGVTKSRPIELSGVLETIAAGLSLVLARPYLLVLPLLADLVTWLGYQVDGHPLIRRLSRLMVERGGRDGKEAAEVIRDAGDNFYVNDFMTAFIPSIFGGVPRDSLFNLLIHTLAPGLTGGIVRTDMIESWRDGVLETWRPGTWMDVVSIAFGMLILGSILLVAFRTPIAMSVRGDQIRPWPMLKHMGRGWLRLIGLYVLAVAAFAVLMIPAMIVSVILLILGLNLVGVFTLALIIFGGLAALYSLFVLDAMLINDVGPIRAIKQSYRVVRANFGPCMQLAFTNLLITTGLIQVWQIIVENQPGIIIALVVNAVVGAGLSSASMMFFCDRYRLSPDPVRQPMPYPYPGQPRSS